LTASLKKTLQTLKSKKSEVAISFVKYTGNISIFSQIKSPAIGLDPETDSAKKLKF
jgi:hypothetical protein